MLRGMASVRPYFFSFLANSSYSLRPIKLKLGMKLDHDVMQCILYRGYSPPNVCSYATLKISVNFSVPVNSSYILHLIKLKLHL